MNTTQKPRLVRDKQFYLLLLTLALPVALQNLVVFLTQMVDTVILGELGDVAMSAASLGSQPFFLFSLVCFGFGGGTVVLTSQYWGRQELRPIRLLITTMLRMMVLLGFVVAVVSYCFPAPVMSIFTKDPAVIEAGVEYLRIVCLCYPFFGFASIYFTTMRSVEVVRIGLVANIVALVINASLTYILVFGKFGFPEMGIKGAAVATLAARLAEFVCAMVHMLVVDRKLKLRFPDFLRFDRVLFRDLMVVSIPVAANELFWSLGISMQAVLLGHLGTEVVTANSIVGVVQQLAMVLVMGVASAAAVIIGKSIGENDFQRARDAGHTFKWLSILFGVLVTAIVLVMRPVAVDFYNVSDEAKELAHQLMYVLSVIGFFMSYSAMGIVGLLRGGGDTKFSMWLEAISLWLFSIPLAFFAAYVLHLPVPAIFFIMKLDELFKAVVLVWRTKTGVWMRSVTRDGYRE